MMIRLQENTLMCHCQVCFRRSNLALSPVARLLRYARNDNMISFTAQLHDARMGDWDNEFPSA